MSCAVLITNFLARHRASRRLLRCRRGVAALEFALLSAPFLIMVFGFIAVNCAFLALSQMQTSSLNAANLMATGQITSFQSTATTCTNSLTNTSAEYYACQNLPSWASFSVTATENCTSPASVTVLITVNGGSAALADTYGFFSGKTLSATQTLMKQGTCP
jgi:Flp pilus assembly protein TadG